MQPATFSRLTSADELWRQDLADMREGIMSKIKKEQVFPRANDEQHMNGWTYDTQFLIGIRQVSGVTTTIDDIDSILSAIELHVILYLIKQI